VPEARTHENTICFSSPRKNFLAFRPDAIGRNEFEQQGGNNATRFILGSTLGFREENGRQNGIYELLSSRRNAKVYSFQSFDLSIGARQGDFSFETISLDIFLDSLDDPMIFDNES